MTPAEEVKQKLDLTEVIGEYVRLQPAGGQSLRGLCPFHGEKTPSFYAHRDKQFWHCFGCGEGGDVYTFYQKIEGVDFRDALKELAARAGVALPEYDPKADSERSAVLAVLEDAAKYYEAALKHETVGARGRSYLSKRKLNAATIAEFRLGYAPAAWDALVKGLLGKGHMIEKIVAAGLAIPSDRQRSHYDRFRDRVMVPLMDHKGTVVGFTGRILPDSPEADKAGKYINTPETAVYRKRELVFGFPQAKPHIRAANFAVLVEGNLDVISSHQAGVKNVVAISGTALTGGQLKQLFGSRGEDGGHFKIGLAFDNDEAGRKTMKSNLPAVHEALRAAWGNHVQVYGYLLPDGYKDPDDLIQKDPELWKALLREAKDWAEISFSLAMKDYVPRDPYSAGRVIAKFKPVLAILREQDPVIFDFWTHRLGQALGVTDEALRREIGQASVLEGRSLAIPQNAAVPRIETREGRLAERLLCLMLQEEGFFAKHIGALDGRFPEGPLRTLAEKMRAYYTDFGKAPILQDAFIAWYFDARLADPALPALEPILLLKDRDMAGWTPEQLAEEADVCARELEKTAVKKTEKELVGALAEAEQRGDRAAATQIAKRLEALAKRLHN